MTLFDPTRAVMLALGGGCAALGCYGAFELQSRIDGGGYLVIAAPLVTASVAVLPPVAERLWKQGDIAKSLCLWLIALPLVAALAIGSAYERVHASKAGQAAERKALQSAVTLAKTDLDTARDDLAEIKRNAQAELKRKACRDECQAKWAAAVKAADELVKVKAGAVTQAEGKATEPPAFEVPVWLLPVCLDLLSFLAIWVAFAPSKKPKGIKTADPSKPRRKPSQESKAKAAARRKLKRMVKAASNDNVLSFPAA